MEKGCNDMGRVVEESLGRHRGRLLVVLRLIVRALRRWKDFWLEEAQ
jgi:hypothetical protein